MTWTLAACLVTSLSYAPETVLAQEDDETALEEIIVTSRRYEESISDAPLAVNVLDGEYLKAQGVNNLSDAIELTPGATWGHFTMAQPGFTVRGIESYNVGNASLESAVQVVVDGIALTKAFMMTPPVYDLERIEFMRGPQGTTFGRNATLGIAHFVTARPSQDFSGSAQVSAGSRNYLGFTGHVNGGLSDTVSARIAVNTTRYDGDLEDERTGTALEDVDHAALRASVLFEPSDTFNAFLKAELVKDRNLPPVRRHESCTVPTLKSPPYINEYTANCDPWKASVSSPPQGGWYENRNITFLTADLAWNVGDMTITSLTGYQEGDHATIMDVFASPEVIQDQVVENEAEVLSTELRIDNKASGDAFTWIGGLYLLRDNEYRLEHNQGAPARGNGAGRINPLATSNLIGVGESETTSVGLFGELSFDMGDSWNITVGGRYTEDTRDYDFSNRCWGRAGGCSGMGAEPADLAKYPQYDPATDCSKNIVNGQCGTEAAPMGIGIGAPLHVSETWDNFSVRASLTWSINDNNNIYALYSEGFKAGGFQHDARNLQSFYEGIVNPETVENYELGWKGSYDRIRFAVTAFMMEQKDAQNSVLVPVAGGSYATDIRNYGGIEMTGFELEATWLPTDSLLIGGNLGLYDGELGPGSVTGAIWDPVNSVVIGKDVSGLPTGLSDTFVLYGEYTFDMSGGSSLRLRADVQHRSTVEPPAVRYETKTLDGQGRAFERPAITNVGARISWVTGDGAMEVALWGQNLLDEYDWGGFGPASSFHFNNGGSGPGTSPRNYWNRVRYGLDLRYNF
jgi:iron complex outermembrane receptor protein